MNDNTRPKNKLTFTPFGKKALHISDIVIAILGIVAAVIVAYIPTRSDIYMSEPVVFSLWAVTAIFAAQMLLLAISYLVVSGSKKGAIIIGSDEPQATKVNDSSSTSSKKRFRAPRVAVLYSLLIIWAIAGWATVTQNPGEEGIIWAGIFIPPFLALFGALIGAMAFLLVVLPLKFFFVSIKELIQKRSLAALGGIAGSIAVMGIASLLVLMPMAVNTDHAAVLGQFAMLSAALGLPGSYTVINPEVLSTARIITWISIAIFATIFTVSRIRKSKGVNEVASK